MGASGAQLGRHAFAQRHSSVQPIHIGRALGRHQARRAREQQDPDVLPEQ